MTIVERGDGAVLTVKIVTVVRVGEKEIVKANDRARVSSSADIICSGFDVSPFSLLVTNLRG